MVTGERRPSFELVSVCNDIHSGSFAFVRKPSLALAWFVPAITIISNQHLKQFNIPPPPKSLFCVINCRYSVLSLRRPCSYLASLANSASLCIWVLSSVGTSGMNSCIRPVSPNTTCYKIIKSFINRLCVFLEWSSMVTTGFIGQICMEYKSRWDV